MSLYSKVQNLLQKYKNDKLLFLVRKGLSVTNESGQITGWIDVDLSPEGRLQAKQLMPIFYKSLDQFQGFFSSDLRRSIEFGNIVLAFNGTQGKKLLKIDKRLRELDFGEHDGSIYDLLPKKTQNEIDSIDYIAPQGESWRQLKERMQQFISEQQNPGKYLIFTHGGSICSLTHELGLKNMINPGSFVVLKDNNSTQYELVFHWDNQNQNNI